MGAMGRNPRALVIGRRRASPLTSDQPVRLTDHGLAQGLGELIKLEPRFQTVLITHGSPPLRHVENSLASLLHIVTEQLISLSAAAAIWARLEQRLGAMTPADIEGVGFDGLRSLGLSGGKARTFLALGQAVHAGKLDFHALEQMADAEAYRTLLNLPGVGPWTAEIYLLTALGRTDIFPAGDRALQLSAQHLFGLGETPTAKVLAALAEGWRPWRAVAARLLWSHYRGLKNMPQAVT